MLGRTLGALVASFVLVPLAADAAEIVQQLPVPPRVFFEAVDTGGAETELLAELPSAFERFDPSLGTLTRIDYAWDYHFRLTIDVTGFGGGSAGLTGPFAINGEHVFSGDGNGGGDGSDTPAVKIVEFSVTNHQEIDPEQAPGSWLLAFVGVPGQEVTLVYEPKITVRSTGDANVTFELLDTSSVTLRYEYLPEPDAPLAGLAAGAALLLARARSGRTPRRRGLRPPPPRGLGRPGRVSAAPSARP